MKVDYESERIASKQLEEAVRNFEARTGHKVTGLVVTRCPTGALHAVELEYKI